MEVDRSDRQDRRRQGKSDPLDAVSAARAAQSGRARGAPKGRDGAVEAIRALMVAKRSARSERTQAINQARALIVTGPEDLRARFAAQATADLVTGLASLRPRPGVVGRLPHAERLRELGCREESSTARSNPDAIIVPLVTGLDLGLIACTASALTPPRCSWSPPGTTPNGSAPKPPGSTGAQRPIPASAGLTKRHRLTLRRPAGQTCGGSVTRMSSSVDPRLRRARTAEGLSRTEIIRCLKRYVARRSTPTSAAPLTNSDSGGGLTL